MRPLVPALGAPPRAANPKPPTRFGDVTRPVPFTSPLAPGLRLGTSLAWHLARRAAMAPTPEIAADIARLGPGGWVEQQLHPELIDDSACETMIARHVPFATMRLAAIKADPRSKGKWWVGAPHLVEALLIRAVHSKRVLLEAVVECLSDQVYVAGNGRGESGVTDVDIDVLRPHALGRYADLLRAALRSPGLLLYLNNNVSSKDNVNENLGRELLELYTVGTGVYTQADVRESARILTGHTLDASLAYRYDAAIHSTGPVRVMSFTHPNAAASDGPAVLDAYADYLARHPRTAERICRRLATRFVSDTPSAALVAELATVYLASDTDLRPVLRRLFAHPEFSASPGLKAKRPLEWAAAGLGARRGTYSTDDDLLADPYNRCHTYSVLLSCGHAPRQWPDVNGFPDVATAWMSAGNLIQHWHGVEALSEQWDARWGVVDWAERFGVVAGASAWEVARRMATDLTGWVWYERDIAPVASYLAGHTAATVPIAAKISAANARSYTEGAVRMVLSSPYALLR